jgi:endonuclease/exonuclease/phosphatase family metal-dependent hydrolase
VAGDFNQDLADTHYYGSRANRRQLTAALQRAGLVALTGSGGDPVRMGSAPNACIDHICMSASPRWLFRSVSRWPDLSNADRRISDHFGVVAEFELAKMPLQPTSGADTEGNPKRQ